MALYSLLYNNQTEVGPMTLDQLGNYPITPESLVRVDNGPFVKAYTVPEIMKLIKDRGNTPPPFTPVFSIPQKDHLVAGLLAILLGSLGVQYFYLGKTKAGVISLILGLCSCGLWQIITVIQGILMVVMTQQEFENKYVYTSSTFPLF